VAVDRFLSGLAGRTRLRYGVIDGRSKIQRHGDTPKTKLVQYGIDFKRVMRGRLVLGIADGWLKADGETIYQATDLRVGLSKEKAS
jgi:hypothetical protein